MSKKATTRRNTPKKVKARNFIEFPRKYLMGVGCGEPLVPHINNPNVMVTQKVRNAQERRRNS